MSRKIENTYTIDDFNNIISTINNIIIGLQSIKYYSYVKDDAKKTVHNHIKILQSYKDELSKVRKNDYSCGNVILNEEQKRKLRFIFKIEDYYQPLVASIWSKELTNIVDFNEFKNYKLLTHMCRNNDELEYILDVINNPNIACISTSLITNESDKVFCSHNSDFGFIYNINENNFLGACENDAQMFTTKPTTNKSDVNRYYTIRRFSNFSINAYKDTYGEQYQMVKTKTPICLEQPYKLKNLECIYNEVGITRENTIPLAIIQYYYGNKHLVSTFNQSKFLSTTFNIPIIYKNRSIINNFDDFCQHRYPVVECMNELFLAYGINIYLNYDNNLDNAYNYYIKLCQLDNRDKVIILKK